MARIHTERIGDKAYNNDGCLMKLIQYDSANDIVVEFQDDFKAVVHTSYEMFLIGKVKNPYHPCVYGVGIIGDKYPSRIGKTPLKEYCAWTRMLYRCYQRNDVAYRDVICCNDFLMYEKFYDWIHSQENFDKWKCNDRFAIDKDILNKGNKIYSSDGCCLVPQIVNDLFIKQRGRRGELPIGVYKNHNAFYAMCNNPIAHKRVFLGQYNTPEQAFISYKKYKESLIKEVANIEYAKSNITKICHNAMMNYEVEITD